MGFFDFLKHDISEEEFQRQQKMQRGLEKTRTGFFQNIVNTLTNAEIDDDLYNDLEEQLILADVGPACAVRLVDELHDEVKEKHLKTGQEALDALRGIICQELNGTEYLAVPYKEDRDNQNSRMEIGYITQKNSQPDDITQVFVREMEKYLKDAQTGAAQ